MLLLEGEGAHLGVIAGFLDGADLFALLGDLEAVGGNVEAAEEIRREILVFYHAAADAVGDAVDDAVEIGGLEDDVFVNASLQIGEGGEFAAEVNVAAGESGK